MPRRSKRLLALAGEDRLVERLRAGDEAAFEVVFERHGAGILSFCRHMLGSQEEAEDAVQQTFASAYRDLLRDDGRELRLKPWLYTIARNRCLSMLRARREQVQLDRDVATAGLAEQVEQRAELRELLGDIGRLPAEQRAALLLAEVADLSHAEIGGVLDCEAGRVKALVFRARSSLIERRDAREAPCDEIREQLAVLSGGSLRRSKIRHHLRACEGCRAYREQVKRQRQLLAAALPVLPPAWLKSHVLGAAGAGGGGAGAASAGGASMLAGGAGAGAGATGSAVVAKVAVLTVLAGAAGVATEAALESHQPPKPGDASEPTPAAGHDGAASPAAARGGEARSNDARDSASRSRRSASSSKSSRRNSRGKRGRGRAEVPGSRGQGAERRAPEAKDVVRGDGPPAVPPGQTVKEQPQRPTLPDQSARPTPKPEVREQPIRPAPPDTSRAPGSTAETPLASP
jgi:RNA polymerase sigma factor (sigma-70 family)